MPRRDLVLLSIVVFGALIVEAIRAARNERAQLARGGVVASGDVYTMMRLAYPGAFAAMIVEGALRASAPPPEIFFAGLAIFAAAKAIKWWAILSLGPFWTFRVVVLAGAPLVASGPYRWIRHPNYVGVVGELAGVALMTGARVAGVVAMTVFGLLLVKRIAVEERALEAARRHSPASK